MGFGFSRCGFIRSLLLLAKTSGEAGRERNYFAKMKDAPYTRFAYAHNDVFSCPQSSPQRARTAFHPV
jgi:hypothetical protein